MYAGVILEDGGKVWSVLNVRGLAIPEFEGRMAEPVVYDGETPDARIARRKAKWTPTEIVYGRWLSSRLSARARRAADPASSRAAA